MNTRINPQARPRLGGAFLAAGLVALGACQNLETAGGAGAGDRAAASAAAAAASSADESESAASSVAEAAMESPVAVAATESAPAVSVAGETSTPGLTQGVLSPGELQILGSPRFKQRFIDSFVSLSDLTPTMDEDEREIVAEAMALFSDDQLDAAAKLLESNRTATSSAILDYYLGNVYYQAEQLDKAVAAHSLAVQKHPRYRLAWGMLAEIQYRQQRYEDAIRSFAKLLELKAGGDDVTYGLLGYCHAKSGNPVAAQHAFMQAMMLAPDTLDWKIGLADSYFRQERYADAAAFFGTLIQRNPSRADLWIERGRAYAMMKEADKAAQMFEWADSLGGSTAVSLMGLGDIYANKGLYGLSAGAYVRAMDKDRDAVDVNRVMQVAEFICRGGALDETAQLVGEIETRWNDELDTERRTRLLKLRRKVAVGRGADAEAVAALEEIVNFNPTDGQALLWLGEHFAKVDEPDKAVLYFERAANIEDSQADAKLRHGELLAKQGKYREAIPFLRDSYDLKPREFVQRFLRDVERVAERR